MRLSQSTVGMRLTALLLLCPLGAVGAQSSQTYAQLYGDAAQACGVLGGASAVCSGPISQGFGYASSSTDNSARTWSNAMSVGANGPYMYGYASGYSYQGNALAVNGLSPVGSNLVFHFLTTSGFGFANAPVGRVEAYYQLMVYSAYGLAVAASTDTPIDHLPYLSNAVQTAGGFDLTLGFGDVTGSYAFSVQSDASLTLYISSPDNAYGFSNFDAQLTGIDAVDANGNRIGSAVFNADGSANLDVTVPEPATLALLGVGLCVMGIVGRRRRLSTL